MLYLQRVFFFVSFIVSAAFVVQGVQNVWAGAINNWLVIFFFGARALLSVSLLLPYRWRGR